MPVDKIELPSISNFLNIQLFMQALHYGKDVAQTQFLNGFIWF